MSLKWIKIRDKIRPAQSVRRRGSCEDSKTPENGGYDSMTKAVNLQDVFLNTLRKEKIDVTVFLMNGFQIRGIIRGYDSFVIMIESEGRQQVIYKHAVSTISPSRSVPMSMLKEEPQGGDQE